VTVTDRIAPGRADGPLRLSLSVKGRVQGVWYRESMRREAQRLGVTGWVENCADGTVAAVLEGSRAQVELLLAWCRQGPPSARVDSVEIREEVPRGEAVFRVNR